MLFAIAHSCFRLIFPIIFRFRALGADNMPASGGVILASNHQSFMDPIILSVALTRPISFMARKSLFSNRFFGALISSVHAFPVARDRGDVAAVRETMRRLSRGEIITVFPEGTRTLDGHIAPLKPGAFVIACRSGVPVVPAVINGAFESWPRNHLLPRPVQIAAAYGRPLYPADFANDPRALADACKDSMLELQARLLVLTKRKI